MLDPGGRPTFLNTNLFLYRYVAEKNGLKLCRPVKQNHIPSGNHFR